MPFYCNDGTDEKHWRPFCGEKLSPSRVSMWKPMHAPRHWRIPVYMRRNVPLTWVCGLCSYYHQRRNKLKKLCSCIDTIYAHIYRENFCLTLQSVCCHFHWLNIKVRVSLQHEAGFYWRDDEDCCWSNIFCRRIVPEMSFEWHILKKSSSDVFFVLFSFPCSRCSVL